MELFTWSEKYSVSISSIDNDHKGLFGLLNKLYDSLASGEANEILSKVISELYSYTQTHFKREEVLMQKANYPHIQEHIDFHRQFEKKIEEYQIALIDQEATLTIDVLSFLRDWLINHIQGVDMHYVPFLKEKYIE
jgi:hemerythrin